MNNGHSNMPAYMDACHSSSVVCTGEVSNVDAELKRCILVRRMGHHFFYGCVHPVLKSVSSRFLRLGFLPSRQPAHFSNHKVETMVKRQKGLTIIQLMVLLLVAGIVGSVLLNIIIEHRCQSDRSAPLCIKQANALTLNAFERFNGLPA